MAYDPIANRRASLRRTISNAQLELDALELVPQEDTYADQTTIRAVIMHRRSGRPVTYLFFKITGEYSSENATGVRWYHTGHISHSHSTREGNKPWFAGWGELQRWLAESGRVVERWEVLEPTKQGTVTATLADDTPAGTYVLTRHVDGTYRG